MQPLITFMYHRVHDPLNCLPTENFKKHLRDLAQRYHIVTPGDKLSKDKLNICLTFDDAYCDFYGVVFPLLKELNIKAILAVSPAYIHEKTELSLQSRYQVPYPQGMDAKTSREMVPFCTWEELRVMAQSGLVLMASHGFRHTSLKDASTDTHQEIVHSKQLLEEKIQVPIEYFIYPFGDFTRSVHRQIAKLYKLGFRIGSAINKSFSPNNQMIYRVDADPFWQQNIAIEPYLSKWNRKYWLNRIRVK